MSSRIVLLLLFCVCCVNAAWTKQPDVAAKTETSIPTGMLDNLVILQYHHVSTKTPA